MNHDAGFGDPHEPGVYLSASNRSDLELIGNSNHGKEPNAADRRARNPAIGAPVEGKPNQILAGIPVFRLN